MQGTRSKDILEDIKKPKGPYGQDQNKDAKAIPHEAAVKLFQKVEDWVRNACVNDAS